ncbi:DUF4150 domain-containing protein [Aquella oligotrophica]|uniref:Type VI secretion protein n=1 Tax=Aquella oligotrophica TaxID=2067065 RepID=A0A2I7N3B9_9NEIS|nr:DUF4150 domain-containing protein [Aquella oligotrophica]AUR50956.1 type VI secretion protein [Aquella oligotrophica]
MFAITKQTGQAMAMPDVCKVPAPPGPPIPTPFSNIGMTPSANPVTQKIMIAGAPALTKASKINPSQGDQPGVAGGLVSGKIMGPVEFVMGSTKVKFEGNPAVFMGNTTKQNDGNAVGADTMPSQEKVMIMS